MDSTTSFADAVIERQENSTSGVVGKLLFMSQSGVTNRFSLIVKNPDGTREGYIYRVQPAVPLRGKKLFREVKEVVSEGQIASYGNGDVFSDAPTFEWAKLGDQFWNERF